MFSKFSSRFGAPGVIAIVALIFAMTGGAWAAKHYVITSTKQIKPTVLKALKGKTGPAGTNGTNGAKGDAGTNGAKGDAGTNGTNGINGAPGEPGTDGTDGTDGKSVSGTPIAAGGACGAVTGVKYTLDAVSTNVCNGADGADGQTGFTETLPSLKTETGTYVTESIAPITFNIPLTADLGSGAIVKIAEGGSASGTECENSAHTGTASIANPEAKPGFFCIFVIEGATPGVISPATGTAGVGTAGAFVTGAFSFGTWAVTAP